KHEAADVNPDHDDADRASGEPDHRVGPVLDRAIVRRHPAAAMEPVCDAQPERGAERGVEPAPGDLHTGKLCEFVMGVLLASASSQKLYSTAPPAYPYSVAVWAYPTASTGTRFIFAVGSTVTSGFEGVQQSSLAWLIACTTVSSAGV